MKSSTSKHKFRTVFFVVSLFAVFVFPGCDDDTVDPEIPVPSISGIAPNVGMVGTEVTISGDNFSPTANDNSVAFNGVQTAVKSASASQLVVDVPDGATSGPVTVRVDGQTATGPTFTILEDGPSLCDASDITEDTVWEDRVPGDAVDYVVECDISIQNNAILTIEPGVVIAFEGTLSGLFTSEGGGLRAIGTSSNPIVFKGTSDNKGVWKGVYFGSDNPQNRLEYVTVMHAGRSASSVSGEVGAVQLSRKNESEGEIVSCTIMNNDGYGLFVNDGTQLKEFSNNTIADNSDAPAAMFFNQLGALGSDSDLSGNDNDYIEVRENEIEDDAVLISNLGIPYRFVDGRKYDITNALEISAGTEMQFVGGSGLRLGSPGTDCGERTGSLNATGTASNPIVFKGTTDGSGTWLGIGFNSSSPNNKLIYCSITGAGSTKLYNAAQFPASVTLQCDSRAIIQNSTISQSGGHGLYVLDDDAELPDFESNTISDNELAPVWIHLPQVQYLDATTSYSDGNGSNYIQCEGDGIRDADLTIRKLDVPYRIETELSGRETYIERNVTIEPGTILEFEQGAGFLLGSAGVDCIPQTGSLNAEGTPSEPIIFRGATAGQGTWVGLGFNSANSANRLTYCEISGGGADQMYNAGGQGNIVLHCEATLTVENSTISDSGGWGIDFVQDDNSLSQTGNSFSNNALGDIAPQ